MNKVINININGLIFHIDEEAFEILSRYLDALKRHFKNTDGGDEILADIESRIAEMLTERLKNRGEVVSLDDVKAVISVMGQPEDMDSPEAETAKTQRTRSYTSSFNPGRRLYRDVDHKIFGGVCSGISEYLGIDPVWIRLAFVLAVFLGVGTGLLIYIVLWIIVPPALSAAEKLEMRGERVNISNIEKTVKENLESIKDRIDEEFRRFDKNDFGDKAHNFFSGLFDGLSGALGAVFFVFSRLLGILVALVSIAAIVSLIFVILGALGITTVYVPSVLFNFIDTSQKASLALILLVIVLGLPFVALLVRVIRYMAGFPRRNRFLSSVFGSVWFLAFIGLCFVGFSHFSMFTHSYSYRVEEDIHKPAHDTLYLKAIDNGTGFGSYHAYKPIELKRIFDKIRPEGNENHMGLVSLDINRSVDGNVHLEKYLYSKGKSIAEARNYAENIRYHYVQHDSLLNFDEGYSIGDSSGWRSQQLELNLLIPDGMVVVLYNGMEDIIYDIDNTDDIYDGDMVGHKWVMSPAGLKCLDCSFDANNRGNDHKSHHKKHFDRNWERKYNL